MKHITPTEQKKFKHNSQIEIVFDNSTIIVDTKLTTEKITKYCESVFDSCWNLKDGMTDYHPYLLDPICKVIFCMLFTNLSENKDSYQNLFDIVLNTDAWTVIYSQLPASMKELISSAKEYYEKKSAYYLRSYTNDKINIILNQVEDVLTKVSSVNFEDAITAIVKMLSSDNESVLGDVNNGKDIIGKHND